MLTPIPSHTPTLKPVFANETQAVEAQLAQRTQGALANITVNAKLGITQTAYYRAKSYTPTYTPTPTPLFSHVDLPAWVSDPKVDILLTLIGKSKESSTLTLVNAESGETFAFPELPIDGYFWWENGRQIGLLSKGHQEIYLIDTSNGILTRIPASPRTTRFVIRSDVINQYKAVGTSVESPDFTLLYDWEKVSFDGQFLETNEYDGTGTIRIQNLQTDEVITVTKPIDGLYNYWEAWSPHKPYLAICSSDVQPGNFYSFDPRPNLRLWLYNIETKQFIASYRDVSLPYWSPDGAQFLYQPIGTNSIFFWGSPPCIFDILSGNSTCFNELKIIHAQASFSSPAWRPDQQAIGYIYFRTVKAPYGEQAGFCMISLSDRSVRCMLEEFPDPEQKIIQYQWSSDGNYISFVYDTACPLCDYQENPQLGIANVETGQYLSIGGFIELGLWRPEIKG